MKPRCILLFILIFALAGCSAVQEKDFMEVKAKVTQLESQVARLEGSMNRVLWESRITVEISLLKAERARRLLKWKEDTIEIREIDAQIDSLESELKGK